jgi:hypothetical protein
VNRWIGPFVGVFAFALLARCVPGPSECRTVGDTAAARSESLPDISRLRLGGGPRVLPEGVAPDPFALAAAPPPRPAASAPSGPAPARPWSVTGLVGARAAVLVRPDGTSKVVTVGERIDSAVVVGISSSGVELEDRGGRFHLKVR